MSDEKVISLGERKKASKEQNDETQKQEPVYCSFCNRPNTIVPKMVQGPGVNICSECTMIAVQYLILEDRMPTGEAQKILDLFWTKI